MKINNTRRIIGMSLMVLIFALETHLSGVEFPSRLSQERMGVEILWKNFEKLSVGERPRVILVLGGGGARGLAHIGVLRVLEQERIPIDHIVGVSVGALIGALYAGGLSVDDIEKMASDVGWNQLTDFSKISVMRLILADDLLSTKRMETFLSEHIGEMFFSDLRIPFTCIATDLRTGERVIFREGPVAIAARASATIPGVFTPVVYRHRFLVDGGLVDNLPTDTVQVDENDFVIGIQPRYDWGNEEAKNVFATLVRSMEIQKDAIISEKKKRADFLIEPQVGNVSLIDLDKSDQCIKAGIAAARDQSLQLKEALLAKTINKETSVGER